MVVYTDSGVAVWWCIQIQGWLCSSVHRFRGGYIVVYTWVVVWRCIQIQGWLCGGVYRFRGGYVVVYTDSGVVI